MMMMLTYTINSLFHTGNIKYKGDFIANKESISANQIEERKVTKIRVKMT